MWRPSWCRGLDDSGSVDATRFGGLGRGAVREVGGERTVDLGVNHGAVPRLDLHAVDDAEREPEATGIGARRPRLELVRFAILFADHLVPERRVFWRRRR